MRVNTVKVPRENMPIASCMRNSKYQGYSNVTPGRVINRGRGVIEWLIISTTSLLKKS